MNCVNHPDNPVSAYCQNCGKALCTNCVRSVAGTIYCEQCLAARLGISGAAAGAAAAGTPSVPGVVAPAGPNPGTAFALGFIPGVGAMYNGQFVKGMIHVLIFAILVGISQHQGFFGIFVAAWIAYQVFDAYQTAKAKRLGLPLPDPFGLNELGAKVGIPGSLGGPGSFGGPGGIGGPAVPPPPSPGVGVPPPAAGFVDPYGTQQGTYSGTYSGAYPGGVPPIPPPGVGPYVPPPFDPNMPPPPRRQPIGAFILIGLGVLFLLNTLNVFNFDWFGRLWPLLIIAFGALLFVRRTREVGPPPPPPPPPTQSTGGPQ